MNPEGVNRLTLVNPLNANGTSDEGIMGMEQVATGDENQVRGSFASFNLYKTLVLTFHQKLFLIMRAGFQKKACHLSF